jgi:hypothetical protein
MAPQLVFIVIVFASFLSGAIGCFSVAGVRTFEVGLVHPATEVGRSAALAEMGSKADKSTKDIV